MLKNLLATTPLGYLSLADAQSLLEAKCFGPSAIAPIEVYEQPVQGQTEPEITLMKAGRPFGDEAAAESRRQTETVRKLLITILRQGWVVAHLWEKNNPSQIGLTYWAAGDLALKTIADGRYHVGGHDGSVIIPEEPYRKFVEDFTYQRATDCGQIFYENGLFRELEKGPVAQTVPVEAQRVHTSSPTEDEEIRGKLMAVYAAVKTLYPKAKKPAHRALAEDLIARKKNCDFAVDTLRQILANRYPQQKRLQTYADWIAVPPGNK